MKEEKTHKKNIKKMGKARLATLPAVGLAERSPHVLPRAYLQNPFQVSHEIVTTVFSRGE